MPALTRKLALAVALASTSAFGFVGMATPAYAAKKEKQPEAPKKNYSKEFVEAYKPFGVLVGDPSTDVATLKAGLPAIEAVATTADDRFAIGQAMYTVGTKAEDVELQRRGVKMMLESGGVDADKVGVYNFLAGQLAYQAEDWPAVRKYVEAAMAAGYTENDPAVLIAESYFNEDKPAEGIAVLDKAIAAKVAAGEAPPENWIKRGLALAYQGQLAAESAKFAGMYVQYYPSADAWGDAIAVQRTFFDSEEQALLDLMRLAQRTGSLRNERDYVDYINSADARRLPGEVQRVVSAGIAAGKLNASDPFVAEIKSVSSGRIAADKSSLADLERDARASNASALTATAAGDAFLSYEQPAKAEEFYTLALAKPGVDTPRVLTRLGIAQLDQGKYAEAKQTFAKVEGARQAIARLWTFYAGQKAGPAAQ